MLLFHGKLQTTAKVEKIQLLRILCFCSLFNFLLAEIPTQINMGETSTLEVQTTINPFFPQNIHVGRHEL